MIDIKLLDPAPHILTPSLPSTAWRYFNVRILISIPSTFHFKLSAMSHQENELTSASPLQCEICTNVTNCIFEDGIEYGKVFPLPLGFLGSIRGANIVKLANTLE
jgi:hypothetical protein